ncbi:AAA family ATPase [Frigidibacter albus]|uniref:AAA family ATPase n=1 Tax=Frigidibacter albus TaxID=1465486 RepID=A0A6L8VNA8_9RHOB|nr:AAA family ATPase [Frigidibacter albus]MZQ91286.1 AAA family ATPase [Frigidibacter albus]NBE32099.1 AAA family ATPase [Frigidibacter albus]GGH63830.1 ATPase AAA [Frigidibacter albus]
MNQNSLVPSQPSRPEWDAYLGAITRRLRLAVALKMPDPEAASALAEAFPDVVRGPLDVLAAHPQLSHLPPDLAQDIRSRDGDPDATLITGEDRPAVPVPVAWLLMAARLAATFRSAERFAEMTRAGAVALLRVPEVRDVANASLVIRRALLPEGQLIVRRPDILEHGVDQLVFLCPDTSDGQLSRSTTSQVTEWIAQSLATDRPVLILVPAALRLPETLRAVLPEPVDVRTVDRDILLATLRRSHSATGKIDEGAARSALPSDRALAMLSGVELGAGLREASAREVALRLAALARRNTAHVGQHGINGSGPAADAARRIAADLVDWSRNGLAWQDVTRSLLLYGPPGTGKSWLAKSLAVEADVPLVTGHFGAWQSRGHLGEMLAGMRETFEEAQRKAPCVLFIDEIDSVGSREGGERHNASYRRQVINAFLLELDGIAQVQGVVTVGACNNAAVIDPAVIRPGRFDLHVEVPMPDASGLMLVLRRHLGGEFPEAQLAELARRAVGQSMAELDANIRNLRSVCRSQRRVFSLDDLAQVLQRGHDPDLHWRVAIHECGHALVATALGRNDVTRVALSAAGGETMRTRLPAAGTVQDFDRELTILLAGRAAEVLVLGDPSAGSGGGRESDLAVASTLALSMHTQMGLGWHGPVWSDTSAEVALRDPHIRHKVRTSMEAAQGRARHILAARRLLLEGMARELVQHRELAGPDLEAWLAQVTCDDGTVAAAKEERAPGRNQTNTS